MDYVTMEQRRTSYRTLSDMIKQWYTDQIFVYGTPIKVTDIEWYTSLTYQVDADEYLISQFSDILFWHQAVDTYYKELYQ
jgi:hypothetical protein